jgi:hypothetical protein
MPQKYIKCLPEAENHRCGLTSPWGLRFVLLGAQWNSIAKRWCQHTQCLEGMLEPAGTGRPPYEWTPCRTCSHASKGLQRMLQHAHRERALYASAKRHSNRYQPWTIARKGELHTKARSSNTHVADVPIQTLRSSSWVQKGNT